MEEHKKTNETKHLEMTSLLALDKIEKLEETNSKLSKEVIRIGDLERSAKSAAERIASLEKTMSERERAKMLSIIEKQSATIESLSYPVVLRDTIMERNIRRSWLSSSCSYDISWQSIN